MLATVAIGAPEARWFVPGSTRLPRWPADRSRSDRYHVLALAPDRSLKRRGTSGACEWKLRLLPPEPVEIGGVVGQLEHWCKFAGPDVDADVLSASDEWVDVHKRIWRDGDGLVEFTALTALGREWWSVSVRACPRRPTRLPRFLERKLVRANDVVATGYPGWLVALLATS